MLCVAAAAGSNQTGETDSSPTLAEELHCDRGWPLLLAALETAKPAAKWRLARGLARVARPAVLQHVSPAAAALLACVWDDTVSRMPPCAVPAALSAAEAQVVRAERLAVPAALLRRCISALEDCKSDADGLSDHGGSQSSCTYTGAAAAMHSLSAAVASIIPGRLVSNSNDDSSGSSVGMHAVNNTSANAEAAPALQAACHPCVPEPRSAGHASTSSSGQVAMTAARHTETPSGCADSSGDVAAAADARAAAAAAAGSGGCGAVSTAGSPAAAGSTPALELGATTAALADSGALSALSALFRLRDKAETRLATLAMLRQLPADEAAVLAELSDGKLHTTQSSRSVCRTPCCSLEFCRQ